MARGLARARTPPPTPSVKLGRTRWRLSDVRFRGSGGSCDPGGSWWRDADPAQPDGWRHRTGHGRMDGATVPVRVRCGSVTRGTCDWRGLRGARDARGPQGARFVRGARFARGPGREVREGPEARFARGEGRQARRGA